MDGTDKAPDFRPLYLQIKELLTQRLASGEWRPGQLVPSEPKLAAEFGVSQGTVRKALDEMAAQNLLVRQQGKGTFVATHTRKRALFHFFHLVDADGVRELPESRVLSRETGRASRTEAQRLNLGARAGVVRIVRVRDLHGSTRIVERITLPAARFSGLEQVPAEVLPNTLYAFYEQHFDIVVAHAEEHLRAVGADADEAALLGVRVGHPLLEIDRIARGHDGGPVEWRVSRCETSVHSYLNELD